VKRRTENELDVRGEAGKINRGKKKRKEQQKKESVQI
jgi:hypothetical protein